MAEPARAPSCRFGPDRRLVALTAVFAVVALAVAVLSGDAEGRLLAGIAAVVLAGYAITDIVCWPRLAASGEGVRIRTLTERRTLPWSQVDAVRVDERTRFGLMSRTLEIDAGSVLVVLSRRALGADPRTVAGMLTAFDPRGG